MLDLTKEFAGLGFVQEQDEDKNPFYVMDFPDDMYVTITDDMGNLPEKAKQELILACYDAEGRYVWGSEIKTFMELQKLCQGKDANSAELLKQLKQASKTLKDADWSSPARP